MYRNDPDVALYQSCETCSRPEAETCIRCQQTQEPVVPVQWFRIAIARRKRIHFLATLLFTSIAPRLSWPNIVITLAQPYQRQRFATEALVCLLYYLFLQRHLHLVVADTDPQNIPACTLLYSPPHAS